MCPIKACTSRIKLLFEDEYSNVQHHLWEHHDMDVIEAHRVASTAAERRKQTHYNPKKITRRRESKATVEFKKKQWSFDFQA